MQTMATEGQAATTTATTDAGNTAAATSTATATQAASSTAAATTTAAVPAELTFAKVEGFPDSELASVKAIAKEMGWDQATASRYYESQTKAHLTDVAAIKNEIAQAQAKFDEINKAHPVFGGAKHAETSERITQVLAFAGEEGKALATFLESQDNAINVPPVRNFLAKLGYALGDGKIVTPGGQSPAPKSLADAMYG
jgi:molybdopterin-guanine dinucleotide biosynthesis protein